MARNPVAKVYYTILLRFMPPKIENRFPQLSKLRARLPKIFVPCCNPRKIKVILKDCKIVHLVRLGCYGHVLLGSSMRI
jgi:hypothetical protein